LPGRIETIIIRVAEPSLNGPAALCFVGVALKGGKMSDQGRGSDVLLWPSGSVAIPSGIALQPTCWKPDTIFAPFKELLGHKDVSTTMMYTHVLNKGATEGRADG
jgi:hypothetical protein